MTFKEYTKLISEITNLPLGKIKKESSFREELDIDSLQMVNLIVEIASRFGLDLGKINHTKDFDTVWSLYRMITRKEEPYEQSI